MVEYWNNSYTSDFAFCFFVNQMLVSKNYIRNSKFLMIIKSFSIERKKQTKKNVDFYKRQEFSKEIAN